VVPQDGVQRDRDRGTGEGAQQLEQGRGQHPVGVLGHARQEVGPVEE
jgi:hypothetical protein